MIDPIHQIEEAKIANLFQQAGWTVPVPVNYERIDEITDRAVLQNIMKDSTTFIFMSFGSAMNGLVGATFGCVVGDSSINYRA